MPKTAPKQKARDLVPVAVVVEQGALRAGLVHWLERSGVYKPLPMASSAELIRAFGQGLQVPLALVQLDMREVSGLVLLGWLRQHRPAVRVLVIGQQPPAELVRRAMRQGARAVLDTDLCEAELHTALRDVRLTGYHYNALLRKQIEGRGVSGFRIKSGMTLRAAPGRGGLEVLSPREYEFMEVLCSLVRPTMRRVAKRMHCTYDTARTFKDRACKKLRARGLLALLRIGLRAGLASGG